MLEELTMERYVHCMNTLQSEKTNLVSTAENNYGFCGEVMRMKENGGGLKTGRNNQDISHIICWG